MFLPICFAILVCVIFGGAIWATINNSKRNEKLRLETKALFDRLIPICNDAYTIEQVNDAWDELKTKSIKDKTFIIHFGWVKTYFELKAYLEGKMSILKKDDGV